MSTRKAFRSSSLVIQGRWCRGWLRFRFQFVVPLCWRRVGSCCRTEIGCYQLARAECEEKWIRLARSGAKQAVFSSMVRCLWTTPGFKNDKPQQRISREASWVLRPIHGWTLKSPMRFCTRSTIGFVVFRQSKALFNRFDTRYQESSRPWCGIRCNLLFAEPEGEYQPRLGCL